MDSDEKKHIHKNGLKWLSAARKAVNSRNNHIYHKRSGLKQEQKKEKEKIRKRKMFLP
jgi:hypothetical protein